MADRKQVAHLLRRATFGPTQVEIDALAARDYADAVSEVLTPSGVDNAALVPAFEYHEQGGRTDQEEQQLTPAWLVRMISTRWQFPEKLVFFWHGHWATSLEKVDSVALMRRQMETFRLYGMGDFANFAKAMVRDPALILWLDGQRNSKRAPNENLARELMELFTLGVGNYTEGDVKAAARALTGWTIDRATGSSVYEPDRHARGARKLLGATADYDADSLIDLLVRQPAHPNFIAARLWHRFGGNDAIPDSIRGAMVAAYGPRHDIRAMLSAMFTHKAFLGSAGQLVKQPVEWAVGALRQLSIPLKDNVFESLSNGIKAMGQTPLRPPSVGGWPSGTAWLTTSSLQVRMRMAATFASEVPNLVQAQARTVDGLAQLLAVDAWTPRTAAVLKAAAAKPQRMIALALVSPEYAVH